MLDPILQEDALSARYKNRLQDAWDRYSQIVEDTACDAFHREIVPFLREHGYGFIAGNGTWIISVASKERPLDVRYYNGRYYTIYPEELPERIREVLETDIPGMRANDLGSLMPAYTP